MDIAPTHTRQYQRRKELISREIAKPSDGLEPSTPSLPCHGLPLVAPARLHKRSILAQLEVMSPATLGIVIEPTEGRIVVACGRDRAFVHVFEYRSSEARFGGLRFTSMAQTLPPFNAGQLEAISRELGEAMTGSQLSRLLPDAGIADISNQSTKWKHIYEALAARQAQDRRGDAVCRFIPSRWRPNGSAISPSGLRRTAKVST